jgi:crossover junction endodeoxyribonuclease RusA
MSEIKLVLPYPISANRYWAHRVITPKGTKKPMALVYVTQEAKSYKQQVAWMAKAAGIKTPLSQRLWIDIKLYPHRPQDWQKRMRQFGEHWDDTVQCIDLGNAEKVLSDALQGVVYSDDKWLWRHTKDRMEPDGEARVVVTIRPLQVETPQASLI